NFTGVRKGREIDGDPFRPLRLGPGRWRRPNKANFTALSRSFYGLNNGTGRAARYEVPRTARYW
ncbi:unnamed protein product, partial [Amoebophrya sp. A25]